MTTPSKEAREIVNKLKSLGLVDPTWEYPATVHTDETLAPYRERVRRLVEAFPTVPHPGGRLVKVIGVYEDGTKQHVDGEVVLAALAPFLEQEPTP